MYKAILFDIDNTLFNFDNAEDYAIHETLKHFNINDSSEVCKMFKKINLDLWHEYEKGLITKPELLKKRFEKLFDYFSINNKEELCKISSDINVYYLSCLSNNSDLMPNCLEMIKEVSKYVKIYSVTNGVTNTQLKRINNSLIKDYFNDYFISEQIGYQKPYKEFFDYVFNHIDIKKEECLLVGDSLSADIKGAIDYGIDSCFYNIKGIDYTGINPKYVIKDLLEIIDIIK